VLGLADLLAVALLALGLFVIAPAAVASAVAAERRSGTLDQLRTTPLSPLGLATGIVVGAPAKLYLLCAGPLALHVVAGLSGAIPVESLVASLCVLACGGLASALFGLAVALAPRQETGGALSALAVAGALGTLGLRSCTRPARSTRRCSATRGCGSGWRCPAGGCRWRRAGRRGSRWRR
jgi:hypothetical protein